MRASAPSPYSASLEQLPGPLLSRDNLASLEVDNVLGAPVAEELGIKPAAFEAIAPSYLR